MERNAGFVPKPGKFAEGASIVAVVVTGCAFE